MIVSIDIGSTWTKGAAFRLSNQQLEVLHFARVPTSVDNLSLCFGQVLEELVNKAGGKCGSQSPDDCEIFYSSSAKGGLAVSALGLVPEITSESAKLAAYSAGAKLTSLFSYLLTTEDIQSLENNRPDILLFAGGTDGGNTEFVVSNARLLAQSSLDCTIIYAGNRAVKNQVEQILEGKEFIAVENLLPTLDAPNPEPVRDAIRSVFLSKIVSGKGLDKIIDRTGSEPLPTPYAMYEFVKNIREFAPDWEEFVLVDIGGATTDVYSIYEPSPEAGTVIRGLVEPKFKRTVEGDLGMRVSAMSAAVAGQQTLSHKTQQIQKGSQDGLQDIFGEDAQGFKDYVANLARCPEVLSSAPEQTRYEHLLAGICLSNACIRHAGRMHQVYTSDGAVNVQVGRDLRKVTRLIGTGGYLASDETFSPAEWLSQTIEDERGRQILLPNKTEYFRDQDYLFPLLANVAQSYPAAAATTAVNSLIDDSTGVSLEPKKAQEPQDALERLGGERLAG